MNKQRVAILIIAAFGMLATFMPWVKIPIMGSINGTEGDGWITLGFYAIPLILTLIGDKTKSIKGGMLVGVIIPSILASVFGIYKIYDFNTAMNSNPLARLLGSVISIEFGLYLIAIAGFAITLVALLIKDKKNEIEQEF